jgi:signal transduction histidine kinase
VWARDPDEGQRNLAKLRQLVRGALAEMRILLFELRPTALEAADFGTLLHQLADALTGRTRIPVELILEAPGGEGAKTGTGLRPDSKEALYRIVQETFNNVAKHSEATQVKVTLRRKRGQAILVIADNGRGFASGSVTADRMGLTIMHERVEAIGGDLVVKSAPGQGTEVTVTWAAHD